MGFDIDLNAEILTLSFDQPFYIQTIDYMRILTFIASASDNSASTLSNGIDLLYLFNMPWSSVFFLMVLEDLNKLMIL